MKTEIAKNIIDRYIKVGVRLLRKMRPVKCWIKSLSR